MSNPGPGDKKRKSPWSVSPAPPSASVKREPGVKVERAENDREVDKKPRFGADVKPNVAGPSSRTVPALSSDPRTIALELQGWLKKNSTINTEDAFYRIQESSPSVDPYKVLDVLKQQPRVEYNENNGVYTYVPELTFPNLPALRTYIRTNATSLKPVPVKTLREALPAGSALTITAIEELEKKGDILIMRALTGQEFKDVPLPRLGKANIHGLKLTEGRNERWKTVWWDEIQERGRAGKRVDDDLIFAWDQVYMAETDDVGKLLSEQELSASSVIPPPPKIIAAGPSEKKKKSNRALKITNTHMKEHGIDFSKDYIQQG